MILHKIFDDLSNPISTKFECRKNFESYLKFFVQNYLNYLRSIDEIRDYVIDDINFSINEIRASITILNNNYTYDTFVESYPISLSSKVFKLFYKKYWNTKLNRNQNRKYEK